MNIDYKSLTTDEWIEKFPGAKLLQNNLRADLEALTDLDEDGINTLLRCHMIMIRQFVDGGILPFKAVGHYKLNELDYKKVIENIENNIEPSERVKEARKEFIKLKNSCSDGQERGE